MLLALVVTLPLLDVKWFGLILLGFVIGALIGAVLAVRIQMTAMPQLVALFNGFGGLASTLVAGAELLRSRGQERPTC